MVPVLRIFRRYRHPVSHVTFPIWAHHRDQNLRQRTCHVLTSPLYPLTSQQTRRKVYQEVSIAGDLSEEDVNWAGAQTEPFLEYGGSTTEFVYGNETVYFAQPSQSQFVAGGSGAGTFNFASALLRVPVNNTLVLMSKNVPKNDTGMVLRYAPPARSRCSPTC